MRILWITNILFPEPCKELNIKAPVTGGWMYSSAKTLKNTDANIELAVATVYKGTELKKFDIDGITYFLLPLKGDNTKYQKSLEPLWQKVTYDFKPDLAHLHGTEFAHGLAFFKACPKIKVIVSIQGLVSVISRDYYYSNISFMEIFKNITLKDIIRNDSIFKQKRRFYKRGLLECKIIKRANHIIGRTSWDKSHVLAINPNVQYHFCNESLRSTFYQKKWTYENCDKHSIFLSQAGYPLKGFHQVVKALPFIISKYPDTKVYIAGNDITSGINWKQKIKISGYGKYIRTLLLKYRVKDNIFFVGFLNEEKMCTHYLKSNLYICPSSIENSPNSLAEAQILGVPCLASYVGGIPDMMKGEENYMYRFEEIEMLATKVCNIFNLKDKIDTEFLRKQALKRHDKKQNTTNLLTIYRTILK